MCDDVFLLQFCQVTILRSNASALGHEVAEMQQQNVSHHQVMADRDYLTKKLDRVREQLSQARADKDRLWEQAREDKALMAKALQELQKQLEVFKTEKEEALTEWKSETTYMSNENSQLKKRLTELQGGNGVDAADHFEIAQLRSEVEHARNQREQIERKLQRLIANQGGASPDKGAQERAQLTAEVARLRDEIEVIRTRDDAAKDSEAEDLRIELAGLREELESMQIRASATTELQSQLVQARHEVELLQQKVVSTTSDGGNALLQQVLSERDAALGELKALTEQVENLRSRGSLDNGERHSRDMQTLRKEVDDMAVAVKQARAERDVLTKYVIKLEADLDMAARRRG